MAPKKRKTPRKSDHLPVTPKAMKYARNLAVGMRKGEALKNAGYSKNSNSTNIDKLTVVQNAKQRLLNEMEHQGVNDELFTRRLKDLLNKEQKALSFGKVVVIDKTDAVAVSKGLELVAKLRGDLAPVEVKNINPMEGMDITQLMGELKKAKQSGELHAEFLPELLPA